MSMARKQINNTFGLVKYWLLQQRQGLWGLLATLLVLTLPSLMPLISLYSKNTQSAITSHQINDFSGMLLFGIGIAIVVMEVLYRQNNNTIAVYPQTNATRFASHLIVNHWLVLVGNLLSLSIYLLQMALLTVVAANNPNLIVPLRFDLGFVLMGFFTYVLYSFLLVAFVALVGAFLRKFHIYAAAVILGLLVAVFTNLNRAYGVLQNVLNFLLKESDPLTFALKAAVLWLVLIGLAALLNHYTVYYKSHRVLPMWAVGSAIGLAVGVAGIVAVVGIFAGIAVISEEQEATKIDFQQITLDISHLPKGSSLKLAGNNVALLQDDQSEWFSSELMYISPSPDIENIQGDTLTVLYRLPEHIANEQDLMAYAHPSFTAHLEGDTLQLEYTYTPNKRVVFVPVWQLASQFTCFQGKNLFVASPLSDYTTRRGGQIHFEVS